MLKTTSLNFLIFLATHEKRQDFDTIKTYFSDGKTGFLVPASQQILPNFKKLVRPSVPILRLTAPKKIKIGGCYRVQKVEDRNESNIQR